MSVVRARVISRIHFDLDPDGGWPPTSDVPIVPLAAPSWVIWIWTDPMVAVGVDVGVGVGVALDPSNHRIWRQRGVVRTLPFSQATVRSSFSFFLETWIDSTHDGWNWVFRIDPV